MKRFVHELRYSRKITHKNVIRIYDFLYIQGNYAISMEYFPSHTLGAEIVNEKPLELKRAIRFASDICTGMTVAHHVGIVHRDLKPANVLINDEGLLKIVDFGVAAAHREGDTQLTKTGYVIGSPKYMAPEQILGKKVDERADVYALGVMLYETVTRRAPLLARRPHVRDVPARAGQGPDRPGDQSEPAARPVRHGHEIHGGRQDKTLPEHGRVPAGAGALPLACEPSGGEARPTPPQPAWAPQDLSVSLPLRVCAPGSLSGQCSPTAAAPHRASFCDRFP